MTVEYTTWNPSDKGTNIVLSNGDLTINCPATWDSVRSVYKQTTGKYYWENTIDKYDHCITGVATSSAGLTSYLGSDTYGLGYMAIGAFYFGATFTANGKTPIALANSDIVCVAMDLDAGKIWFGKNGVWIGSGDPTAGTDWTFSFTGGLELYAAASVEGGECTANFGSSAFSYSVPSGFMVGFGDVVPIVTLTYPLQAISGIQSNIQVEIIPGSLQTNSSLSVGEVFWGNYIECSSPFAAESSLQAKIGLEIAVAPLIAQTNLKSNLQIELVTPPFAAQSELSVGEIFWGYEVDIPEPFSANASFQANTQIELVTAPLIATSTLLSNIGIEISAGVLNNTGAILGTPVYPIILTGYKRVYLFTLTGAADGVEDIVIPIRSFQSRLKSGESTYLSVVIPGTDYASAINLRLNGDLVVRMGYLSNSEIILSEIISIVDFENIIIYDGTTNKTITLDGHRTETFTPKEINLTGSSYKNITAGKLRYRCTPNLYVRPGDVVNIDEDSFTIKNITYYVSPELETFEVSE